MLLLVVGLLCCALYRVVSGSEHHAYSAGAEAPQSVHLTAGTSYTLSVPGGVRTLLDRGVDVSAAQCQWSIGGSAAQALTVTAERADTKATNVVATFIAPFTGDLHIDCAGWGGVFVDNADNTSADVAGWFLLVGVIALTLGVGLGLSEWRLSAERRSAERTSREDDQVETLVGSHDTGFGDHEIGGTHLGDVTQ
jgi:hypothetical protein